LRGNVGDARQVLGELLSDRLVFTPTKDEEGSRC